MKEIQQFRRIALKIGVSGTVIPISETRLYKGGYGFVVLQAYVPYTQNRSQDTSPLCTVFRTTLDKFGNRKQFNKDIYNMIYTEDVEIENAKYMVFETPLPKAFTETAGELELVFTYSEVNTENKAAARLASGIYKTVIEDSDVSDGETVDPVGGELARLNDFTLKMEKLEDSVDALLQAPDYSEADIVGTAKVEVKEDGRLKFSNLKGAPGHTPQKDVDYWTDSDKHEIVELLKSTLPIYEVDDELAGTWLLNNIIDLTESHSWNVQFYFFKENGVDKVYGSKIFIVTDTDYDLVYSTQIGDLLVYSNGWGKESYQLITITSKLADVGNGASLLSFLKANGEKKSGNINVSIKSKEGELLEVSGKYCPSNIMVTLDESLIESLEGEKLQDVETAEEMDALLVEENVGKIYRFLGVTDDKYTNGCIYEVVVV